MLDTLDGINDLKEARELNKRLHRRVQALEAPYKAELTAAKSREQSWFGAYKYANEITQRRERQMCWLWLIIVSQAVALTVFIVR